MHMRAWRRHAGMRGGCERSLHMSSTIMGKEAGVARTQKTIDFRFGNGKPSVCIRKTVIRRAKLPLP